MAIIMYHNPRCTKSRQTLQLLRDRGIEPRIIEYLKEPPSPEALAEILGMLGMEPRELMRRKESVYKEKQLDDPGLSHEDLLAAMVDNPILIERPIVINGQRAAVGRPPENILEIL